MRKLLFPILAVLLSSALLFAEENAAQKTALTFDAGISGTYDAVDGLSNMDYGKLLFKQGPFSLIAHLSFNNDGKYAAAHANTTEGSIGGYYFFMDEGGLLYDGGNLSMKVGRFRHYDQIDSPYSLFVNSNGITANLGQLRYENESFVYETRWVELNHRSSTQSPAWNAYWNSGNSAWVSYPYNFSSGSYGFPERGVNLKTYALKFGKMRFGLQDTAVYSGSNFDAEYFVNPIPSYFIQYMKGTSGRPWATSQNDNCILGLFWDWERDDGSKYYVQYLMDDFYIPGLSQYLYPNQMAWALGGSWKTDWGTIGAHHGGALKYTFQSNSIDTTIDDTVGMAYGYTYYPDTAYYSDGSLVEIDIEDNSFGFKYGENSAAFQIDWQNRFADTFLRAAFEFVLAGSNSACNPWHDATSEGGLPTEWLGDSVLQKTFALKINAARKFGPLDVSLALKGGYIFNVLELTDPSTTTGSTIDKSSKIWKPSGNNKPIFTLTLGIKYVFKIL